MTDNDNSKGRRRAVLKGLVIGLPAAWTAPLVKTVILPAHAQTSGCGAPPGCYQFQASSFQWPGGTGPYTVAELAGPDCTGRTLETFQAVVAANFQEAHALLPCVDEALSTNPPAPEGCQFWACL